MIQYELGERFGTPLYVYDLAEIRQSYLDLQELLPKPSKLYYSLKANPHPNVAGELATLGCSAEVSSVGEISAALAAGYAAADILMTGPGKSEADIVFALHQGVTRFSVDSPTDLARVGTIAQNHTTDVFCLLRLNADEPVPGMGLSMTGTASAFGADASWVLSNPELFRESGTATVVGLHLYMGTNISDSFTLLKQFETSIALAAQVREALNIPLDEIDLGGGFGMPYARQGVRPLFSDIVSALIDCLDSQLAGWRTQSPQLSFESGRYLVGSCGTLVCRVLDVKSSKGQNFVVLDGGINCLGGMSGLRRVPRIVPDIQATFQQNELIDKCSVVGPLCTPLDIWSQGVQLPQLVPGDLVTIPNVGAYGLTASLLAFLGHKPAKEIVIDEENIISVSQLSLNRQTYHHDD